MFGLGCFWGAEKKFWQLAGVYSTAVGYAAGPRRTRPIARCAPGMTGHNEVVLVVFDPKQTSATTSCSNFWENHDPTQGMRQGNDVGTQYRSASTTHDAGQKRAAEASRDASEPARRCRLRRDHDRNRPAPEFYYAEDYHQQYLAKNPNGYCGLGGTGSSCPVGVGRRRLIPANQTATPLRRHVAQSALCSEPLPIDAALDSVRAPSALPSAAVVVAEPGAGKTTRLPPALLDAGRAIVLQPRRAAARSIARRIAANVAGPLAARWAGMCASSGASSADTRLLVATEGC